MAPDTTQYPRLQNFSIKFWKSRICIHCNQVFGANIPRATYYSHVRRCVLNPTNKCKTCNFCGGVYPCMKQHLVKCHARMAEKVYKPLPSGLFDVAYLDPPYRYDNHSPTTFGVPTYKTLKLQEISALQLNSILRKDALVFVWTTGPMILKTAALGKAWGLTYKTIFTVWVKTYNHGGVITGVGHYSRPCCEFLLVFTKGKDALKLLKSDKATNISQLVTEKRAAHSVKPESVRRNIEEFLVSGLKKIELFARRKAKGWTVWGNEV